MERFWNQVAEVNGCWLYTGGLTSGGYARARLNGTNVQIHRYVYEQAVGAIPTGLVLDHLCRVRNCVNPWHLEPVTYKVNSQRGDTGKHQSAKTHCKYGHEYTEDNTKIYRGRRHCKACKRWRDRNRGRPASDQLNEG